MTLEEEVIEVHGLGRIAIPGLRILRNIYEAAETDMVAAFQYVEPTLENLKVYSVQVLEAASRRVQRGRLHVQPLVHCAQGRQQGEAEHR